MSKQPVIFERLKLDCFHDQLVSPGSFHGNRVTVGKDLNQIYFASGTSIYGLTHEFDRDNNLIPNNQRNFRTEQLKTEEDVSHEYEICNILYKYDESRHEGMLYSIDMKGNINVRVGNKRTFHLLQPSRKVSQLWCGLDTAPNNPDCIITAMHLNKTITLYNEDRIVRSINTTLNPTQIMFLDENLIAVTELNTLSLLDIRQKGRISYVKRMQPYNGPLYALNASGNYLGVAGFNRSLAVFDTRKLTLKSHWSSSLKYEITKVIFSSTDPTLCYVSGLDSEILCGKWDGTSQLSHFDGPRVESRWIGLSHHVPTDTIVGYTEQGYCYIIKNDNLSSMEKE